MLKLQKNSVKFDGLIEQKAKNNLSQFTQGIEVRQKKIHKKMQQLPLKKWQKRRLSKHKFRRFCTTHSNSPFVTHNTKKYYVVMNLSNLKLAVYHIFFLKPFDFLVACDHMMFEFHHD